MSLGAFWCRWCGALAWGLEKDQSQSSAHLLRSPAPEPVDPQLSLWPPEIPKLSVNSFTQGECFLWVCGGVWSMEPTDWQLEALFPDPCSYQPGCSLASLQGRQSIKLTADQNSTVVTIQKKASCGQRLGAHRDWQWIAYTAPPAGQGRICSRCADSGRDELWGQGGVVWGRWPRRLCAEEPAGDLSTQPGRTLSAVQLKANFSHNVIIHPGKEGSPLLGQPSMWGEGK